LNIVFSTTTVLVVLNFRLYSGPGTGIAPFRSICHHRAAAVMAYHQSHPDTAQVAHLGDLVVFLGNRKIDSDWLYQDEWGQLLQCGAISRCFAAFSRDLSTLEDITKLPHAKLILHPQPSKYVQNSMQQQGELLWRLLAKEGGIFMVAG
jgi:sulfite reductase alpha subunit-like flavoprotein